MLLGVKLYDGPEYNGPWNFGPTQEGVATVSSVATRVVDTYGFGSITVTNNCDAKHEATLLSLDITKARTLLNWTPKLTIDTAIEWTVDWYKNYRDCDVYDLCVSQIKSYSKRIV